MVLVVRFASNYCVKKTNMDALHSKLLAACISLCILATVGESFPTSCGAITVQSNPSQRNNWRGLIPLHSTQKDVEQLLGTEPIVVGSISIYKGPIESVLIRYVKSNCSSKSTSWNVPINTIEDIEVSPMSEVTLGDLKLDVSKFQRIESWHEPNIFFYRYPEGGFAIETLLRDGHEEVLNVIYGPTNDDKKLRCTNRPL